MKFSLSVLAWDNLSWNIGVLQSSLQDRYVTNENLFPYRQSSSIIHSQSLTTCNIFGIAVRLYATHMLSGMFRIQY